MDIANFPNNTYLHIPALYNFFTNFFFFSEVKNSTVILVMLICRVCNENSRQLVIRLFLDLQTVTLSLDVHLYNFYQKYDIFTKNLPKIIIKNVVKFDSRKTNVAENILQHYFKGGGGGWPLQGLLYGLFFNNISSEWVLKSYKTLYSRKSILANIIKELSHMMCKYSLW